MTLERYNEKEDRAQRSSTHVSRSHCKSTNGNKRTPLLFVIQKYKARKLHYDLRLEVEGVLKSWTLPKGPSLDPQVKRLAVEVDDHPLSYKNFEGRSREGVYGEGEVIVWDAGTYEVSGGEVTMRKGIREGRLTFVLRGKKVHGTYSMVRFQGKRQWLIRKRQDKYASLADPTLDYRSVISSRTLPDLHPTK